MLEERELPDDEEVRRLYELSLREFSVAGDPGFRFSKTPLPNEHDLLPRALHHKGGGTVGRFQRLEASDPVRTEVLCYLATRDALRWLEQHYPPERLEAMRASGQYRPMQRARFVEKQFQATTSERELRCLANRHPDSHARIAELVESIQREEIEAFRRVLRLELSTFPNRS